MRKHRRTTLPAAAWFSLGLILASTTSAQDEELVAKIQKVAIEQEDLPNGWAVQENRVEDPLFYTELSKLNSMMSSLEETGSIHLGYSIVGPQGPFNIEYFAFARPDGASVAEPYFKDVARKQNWVSFRLGDVILLGATSDRETQETIVQLRLVPFLEKLLQESMEAEAAGNLAAAEKGYYALVQTAPVYSKAWLRLGTIYQRATPPKNAEALEAYQKAIDSNKSSASLSDQEAWQAMIGLGRTNLMEGNVDTALQVLQDARLLGGKIGGEQESKSDYFIATAYAVKKDEDKMAEYLEAALSIQKEDGKSDLVELAKTDSSFDEFKDKKKFKKLLKKFGKD